MHSAEALEKLRQTFADASITLDPDLKFDGDLAFDEIDGLDSVSRVRLTIEIEDAFAVQISPRENSKLKTLHDLVALIQNKRRGA